jgi:hypothetical protein
MRQVPVSLHGTTPRPAGDIDDRLAGQYVRGIELGATPNARESSAPRALIGLAWLETAPIREASEAMLPYGLARTLRVRWPHINVIVASAHSCRFTPDATSDL